MEQKSAEIFKKVAQKLGWETYEISSDLNQDIGNGFMSEMFFASIKNKDSGEIIDLALKSAFSNEKKRLAASTGVAFSNEIAFYDSVVPELQNFVREKGVKEDFDFIARYFASIKDDTFETIAMENLKTLGYQMVDRLQMLDEEHVKFIFWTYGKYHGISFAYKDQYPEKFRKMVQKGVDLIKAFEENGSESFGPMMKAAYNEGIDAVDEETRKGCQGYCEDPYSLYKKTYEQSQNSKYNCLLHGDCWSNNMLFKYKDSKLVSMKLLDFQLLGEGSPVQDLSYFLYSGAPIEIYSNLDQYLKIYHDSLSKTISSLGSDPQKLFPWEALQSEWKKYSKIGISLGVLLNKIKLVSKDDAKDMVESSDFLTEVTLNPEAEKTFKNRFKDLVEYTYKAGLL